MVVGLCPVFHNFPSRETRNFHHSKMQFAEHSASCFVIFIYTQQLKFAGASFCKYCHDARRLCAPHFWEWKWAAVETAWKGSSTAAVKARAAVNESSDNYRIEQRSERERARRIWNKLTTDSRVNEIHILSLVMRKKGEGRKNKHASRHHTLHACTVILISYAPRIFPLFPWNANNYSHAYVEFDMLCDRAVYHIEESRIVASAFPKTGMRISCRLRYRRLTLNVCRLKKLVNSCWFRGSKRA